MNPWTGDRGDSWAAHAEQYERLMARHAARLVDAAALTGTERVLERHRGRIDRCAEHCGLSRRSISEKLRRYQIDKTDFKPANRRSRKPAPASPFAASFDMA